MSEPFLGEIRLMSFVFPPQGWALCNGQLLPINQNQALYSLLGTAYGGNGQTTFALPDLRGRVPIHVGPGFARGASGGEQTHALTAAEMPAHVHAAQASASTATTGAGGTGVVLAQSTPQNAYGSADNLAAMAANAIGNQGGSQAHPNMQPYLTLSFCIATQGIFPSPN